MVNSGAKQKRHPKIKDKKQSARFIEAAKELGADEASGHFDDLLKAMANTKSQSKQSKT